MKAKERRAAEARRQRWEQATSLPPPEERGWTGPPEEPEEGPDRLGERGRVFHSGRRIGRLPRDDDGDPWEQIALRCWEDQG